MKTKLLTLLATLHLLMPVASYAHVGGGSPFVLINQEYATANPLEGLQPDMPLDIAPSTYLPGQPINFAIDRNVFGSPDIQFRWTWDKGGQPEVGDKLSHTYTTVGSHLLTLEIKSDPAAQFTLIDTILMPIVPRQDYKLPTAKVRVVNGQPTANGWQVGFDVVSEIDSSSTAKYSWQFNDGNKAEGQNVTHSFDGKEFRVFPLLIIEDSNGLKNYLAFELDATPQGLQAFDIQDAKILANPGPVVKGPSNNRNIVLIAITGLGLAGLFLGWRRSQQRGSGNKNRKKA